MSSGIIHAIAVPLVLHVGGTALPMKNVFEALGDLGTGILKHKSPQEISLEIGQDLAPIALTAAGISIPYAGFAIAGVALMIKFSKPPTPEDQQRMWDQATGAY